MAKTFTSAEQQEAVKQIKKRFDGGLVGRRFSRLPADKQLVFANKMLQKHGKRKANGEMDWTAFFKALGEFLQMVLAALAPFLKP